MGHRALVAYERPTEGYTVRYSQWGADGYRLLESVTASTPLGGTRGERGTGGESGPPLVRPGPLGVANDLADVAESYVDALAHEAVFVVSDSFCVRAFEPLAFWGAEPTTAFGGGLVSLRRERDPRQDARELRAWRRGATAATFRDEPHVETIRAPDPSGGPASDEDASTRQRIHERLYGALEREVTERTVVPIPPRSCVENQQGTG